MISTESKKTWKFLTKRTEVPKLLSRLKMQEKTKPANLWFKLDSNVIRKVLAPRRPEKRSRDEVEAIDMELFLRNNEKNQFEFNDQKMSKSTGNNRRERAPNYVEHLRKKCGAAYGIFFILDLKTTRKT